LLGIISKVGFPIVSCAAAGYFVFLTIQFILTTTLHAIEECNEIVEKLDKRVIHMTNDMVKLDILISSALNVKPDIDRVARSEQSDTRKD
jgi:hypothetical protein